MKRLAAAGLVIIACLSASAQSRRPASAPRPKPSTISGRVLTEDGNPLRNARVAAGDRIALTDGDGRFELAAADARLHVSKAGYAPLDLAATDAPVQVRMARGAVISGRVLDGFGDPVVGVAVTVAPAAKSSLTLPPAITDDTGEYRVGSLPPGSYTVKAAGSSSEVLVGVIVDGPGIRLPARLEAAALTVTLEPGEERALDLTATAAGPSELFMPAIARQSPPRGSATLRGHVFVRDGRPLADAQVRLVNVPTPRASQPGAVVTSSRAAAIARAATTNHEGVFQFPNIPAGSYRVTAARTGYTFVDSAAEVALTNDAVADVDLVLDRNGAVAGIVTDEAGDPVEGALVQALHVQYLFGRRQLTPATATRRTDDRGAYRLFGLVPGNYVVTAAVDPMSPAALPGYARSYFPGTDDATTSQFVTLEASQTLPGVNLALTRARTARIRGRILDAAGDPTTGGRVQLIPSRGSGLFAALPMLAIISPGGRFEFDNVPPGQYLVHADRGRRNPSVEGEFGVLPVAVDGRDIANLVLQMTAGALVRGEITMHAQNSATAPPPASFEIAAVPADFDNAPSQWASAWPRPDGSFEMGGLHGSRRLQVHPPAGWIVETIRVNGADATDAPVFFGGGTSDVEVVVTDRAAAVFGTVIDDRGRPAGGAHVVLYPADAEDRYFGSRYFAHVEAQADGTFAIAAMPSGSYYAVALPELPQIPDAWQDPQLLGSLERQADSLTLRDTGAVSLRLRLARP